MFRILSLDGGGIKGAFTTSVLATLEEETGQTAVNHFDLITGTSTGGILALGLGLGISASEILKFYSDKGPVIFPKTSLVKKAKQLFCSKHSSAVLRKELTNVFGTHKFGESKCRLALPTYDAISGRIFVMKTAHHERFKYDINALAVDVALATSAAPTYFDAAPFPVHKDASYVDGGVWANNPVMVGVTEAVAFLGASLGNIDVLSIGTTAKPSSIAAHTDDGVAQWNIGLVDLMFEGQMEAAHAQAKLLLNDRLHRINVTAMAGEFSLDDASTDTIRKLINLGRSEAVKKEHLEIVKNRFLNYTLAPVFTPMHSV